MDYVIRLQQLDGYQQEFSNVFNSRFTRVLCVPHTGKKGDNPHYHFAVTCDYKQQALRAHLKKHFTKGRGNRHVSIKVWDGGDKACSYMFHEGTEPLMKIGFSDRQIEDFKMMNERIQTDIKKNAPAKIVEDATEHFWGKNPSHATIFMWIMNRLRANGDWLPNKYQMDRWILRIEANVRTDTEWKSFLINLYEGWYGNFTFTGSHE